MSLNVSVKVGLVLSNTITDLLTLILFDLPSVLLVTRKVFEDTYLLVHDEDGEEWADALRYRINERVAFPVIDNTKQQRFRESDALLPISPQDSASKSSSRREYQGTRGRFWRGRRKKEKRAGDIESGTSATTS